LKGVGDDGMGKHVMDLMIELRMSSMDEKGVGQRGSSQNHYVTPIRDTQRLIG
jgi:hypothetical protein